MKYIRTYGDYNSWKLDYSNPDRGFRLAPTLYRYPYTGYEDAILLELDDPRKHGDSTYIKIYIDSDIEFSFYIGNKPGDTQTTMKCTIDWGDGVIEDKNITADGKGFKLSHSYTGRNFRAIELYSVERDYSIVGDTTNYISLISHPSIVKNVILGNSVVSIGDGALCECSGLTSIYIPEGVTTIGGRAFSGCSSLTSVYIPEGVTSIGESLGDGVFQFCSSLTSIYIPRSVTSIGRNTFNGCTSLTSIDIPEGVTTIEDGTFNNCTSLSSISLHSTTAPIINGYAFDYLPANGTLHIKPGVIDWMWEATLDYFDNWRIVEDL